MRDPQLYTERGTISAIMIAKFFDEWWPQYVEQKRIAREQMRLTKDKIIMRKKVKKDLKKANVVARKSAERRKSVVQVLYVSYTCTIYAFTRLF
jgi:hypothetical protein